MDKNKLEERIRELETAINQSMANHNAINGRLIEAKYFLEQILKEEGIIVDGSEC